MSLFDFVFPEQAQAVHLRTLAENSQREAMSQRAAETAERLRMRQVSRLKTKTDDRVEKLENQLAQSALIIESLVTLLDEKGVVSRDELKERVARIDAEDGVIDGKITPPSEKPFVPKRDWPG